MKDYSKTHSVFPIKLCLSINPKSNEWEKSILGIEWNIARHFFTMFVFVVFLVFPSKKSNSFDQFKVCYFCFVFAKPNTRKGELLELQPFINICVSLMDI